MIPAWAAAGRVDIVGVAPGKIVPSGRTKSVQPLENAVVTGIHVSEGQHVEAGQVLVELDPTAPGADKARLTEERLSLALDQARLATLLARLADAPEAPTHDPFAEVAGALAATRLAQARARVDEQLAEYRAAVATIDEDRREKEAARAAVDARIAQLDGTLPLITEEAESHEILMATGMVARVK